MTAQSRGYRDREPGPAAFLRRASGPPPADEVARLTGPSRDLLYGQMCLGDLAYVKVGRRCLIARRHLQQLSASLPGAATR